MQNMGERIRAVRKAAGVTQRELAERLGIFYQQISQYERGERNPKYETVEKIADALGISVEELIRGG